MTEFMVRDLMGTRVDVVSPVGLDPADFAGMEEAVELTVDDVTLTLSWTQARDLALALLDARG